MPANRIFRMGSPREPIFNSIQARRSRSWTFTSGILSRDVDGSLRGETVLEQAAVIRGHLDSVMDRAGVNPDRLALVELYWVAGEVDPDRLDDVLRVVIPESARPALRSAAVVALNSRGLKIEVAFTFHEDVMTDADDVSQGSSPLTAPARWAGELLLLSGQTDSLGPEATMAERYADVLDKLLAAVRSHGLDAGDIVQTTTFILDEPQSDDFRAIGDVRRSKLSVDSPPVGTMLRVAGLAEQGSRVAMSAMAVRGGSAAGQDA